MTSVKNSKNDPEGPSYNYTGDKGAVFGSRHKQIITLAIGLAITFGTKYVLSLAIVAMTDSSASPNPDVPTYGWTNTSVIISAILWSGVAVNLLAGYLGEKYGPKWLIVGASLLNSCFFILIPLGAKVAGSTGVLLCRIFQGLALGFLSPLSAIVFTRWVPPEERSRMAIINSGLLSILVMVMAVGTGFIGSSWLGWPWIFYIFGIINIVWTVFYTFFGRVSPDTDKGIKPAEKKYIKESISVNFEKKAAPWKKMLLSMPFWAVVIGQAGFNFMTVLLSTEITIYMAKILKFDLKTNAAMSVLPSFVGLASGIGLAILSDVIVKKNILSVVNSRRIFQVGGTIGVAFSLIMMTYIPLGYKIWTIVILCFSNICVIAAAVGGATTNIMDVSAKYAGVITGFGTTLSEFVSIFAPLMVHWICTDEYDNAQWRIVFIVCSALSISAAIFFAIFATDKQQNWDGDTYPPADLRDTKRLSVISLTPGLGI